MTAVVDLARFWLLTLAWQGSLILALGLGAARVHRVRPARAHAILWLTLVAALAAPTATMIVRGLDWGQAPRWLARSAEPAATENGPMSPAIRASSGPAEPANVALRTDERPTSVLPSRAEMVDPSSSADMPRRDVFAADRAKATHRTLSLDRRREGVVGVPWRAWLRSAWLFVSLGALVRLVHGGYAGWRLVGRSSRSTEGELRSALRAACQGLGLPVDRVELAHSSEVPCPLIWCWRRGPVLLVPEAQPQQMTGEQWTAVFAHELAHWKRRDHWAALAAEVVCCLLPWQVLAWWVKGRLAASAEEACDDWSIASGHSPLEYAESLLALVPARTPRLALAVVGRHTGLAARVTRLLAPTPVRPTTGGWWSALVMLGVAGGVASLAFCQPRQAEPPAANPALPAAVTAPSEPVPQPAEIVPAPLETATEPNPVPAVRASSAAMVAPNQFVAPRGENSAAGDAAERPQRDPLVPHDYIVSGTVLDPAGRPLADAEVRWFVRRRGKPPANWIGNHEPLADTRTDAQGHFRLEATLVESEVVDLKLHFHHPDTGLQGRSLSFDAIDQPLEVHLDATFDVNGTLLSPAGQPVAGARVTVTAIERRVEGQNYDPERWYLGPLQIGRGAIGETSDDWPGAQTTDAEGRFTWSKLTSNRALVGVLVEAPEYGPLGIWVGTSAAVNPDPNSSRRDPVFTLVLEPPYVIHGKFLDEATGDPIPGVRLDVRPNNLGSGHAFLPLLKAVSDSRGEYLLRASTAEWFWVQVYPPLGYGGIDQSFSPRDLEKLSRDRSQIKYTVRLRRGRIVTGRVVEAGTGVPVAGALVRYLPARGQKRPLNDEYRGESTDADGHFAVTAGTGEGYLSVEAAGQGFYRLAVTDRRLPIDDLPFHPHGLGTLSAGDEANSSEPVIELHRGPELRVRVVGPRGEAVPLLRAACREFVSSIDAHPTSTLSGTTLPGGLFQLEAAEPGRAYRAFLFSDELNAGAVADLVAPADGSELEVRLQPCGTVRGRLVYEDGTPARGIELYPHFRFDAETPPDPRLVENDWLALPFYGNFVQSPRTHGHKSDDDGRWEIGGIVPGVFLYHQSNYSLADGRRWREIGVLSPGEARDIGDLVIAAQP